MTESALTKIRLLIVGAALIGILSTVTVETSVQHPKIIESISVGTKLQAPKGYSWPADKPTLVLALRVGCKHCENEMDFYKHLLALEESNELHAHLVAFLPNSDADVRQSFSSRLIGLKKIADVNIQSLKIKGTPTLFIVDQEGIVRSTWEGELPADKKQSMIRALEAEEYVVSR